MKPRVRLAAVVAALLVGALGAPPAAGSGNPGAVRLLFFDATGHELSAHRALAVTVDGPNGFRNDALLDPASLVLVRRLPLFVDGSGELAFHVGVGQHLALEVNWPTATRGYSALVLDNGGAGFSVGTTVNFTYAAASDVARRLDLELAARPGYLPSAAFEQSRTRAERDLAAAQHARSEVARGRLGQLALNELAVANDLLLTEYGVQFARSHAASSRPWLGLTMDRISHYQSDLARARRLTGPYGWMRLVFDRGEPPSHYLSAVRQAKALGIHVLGQPIDSAYAHFYDRRGYLAREAGYIDYFHSHGNLVDAWEVGNEVNGEWLGPQMGAKVADSAAYARAHSGALVVVTLFWQLGTASTPINATFNWARRYLPPAVQRNVDVVLLSTYPDGAPMGLALDQVLRTMHAALPSERIGIGELGYYPGPGEGPWWYCTRVSRIEARACVANLFYRAALGYPYSVDGVFWWYFSEDFPREPELDHVVSAVREAVRG